MGRRKFCLSKLPKNVERKCKGQRLVGRPRKSPCSAGVVRPALEPVVVHPVPEPVVVRPVPEPVVVRPAPEPVVVRPAPEPVVVRPAPEPFDIDINDSGSMVSSNCGHVLSPITGSSLGCSSFLSSSHSGDYSSDLTAFVSSDAEGSSLSSGHDCVLSSSLSSSVTSPSDEFSFSFADGRMCSPTPSSLSYPDSASCSVMSAVSGPPLAVGFQSLMRDFVLPDAHWAIQSQGMNNLALYKVSTEPSSSLVITHSVRIKEDLTWSLSIHGFLVDSSRCRVLSGIPEHMCPSSLEKLLKLLDKCNVCPGNPDDRFVEMVEAKKGQLMSKDGKTVTATVDSFSSVFCIGKIHAKTVRVSTCELLADGNRCTSCMSYRDSLRSMHHRWLKQKSLSPSKRQSTRSKTNLRWLSTPEKCKRYSHLRTRLDAKAKVIKRLKEKVQVIMEKNRVALDPALNSDFKAIMSEMSSKVHAECAEDSFKRVFWDQQLKAADVKDSRQVRWHPGIIKWCLHLKFISSGGYHALRRSGLIALPSERTLRDYTHWIRAGVGFIPEVDAQLVNEAKITSEKDKFVVLSWDEMKIKEDLVFDKHTCTLVGFTNVGEINDVLDKVEQQADKKSHCNVSTHMLLFMVRGMFSTLEFPYAHFATRGISCDSLYPIVWEAVQHLECCGMKVIAFCCDGASPNRKFYKMHGKSELTYKTPNPFCDDRDIFFICDVPHLLKTTRNCWENSFANKYSRALWVSYFPIAYMYTKIHMLHTFRGTGSILAGPILLPSITATSQHLGSALSPSYAGTMCI